MWSVVTESPKIPSTRAPITFPEGFGCAPKSAKKGGSAMYVEVGQS